MTGLLPLRVLISPDRKAAKFIQGDWNMSCPVLDLPKWLKLYSSFAAKRPQFYAQSVEAIRAAMKRADIPEEA